jgi:hypothetical protein
VPTTYIAQRYPQRSFSLIHHVQEGKEEVEISGVYIYIYICKNRHQENKKE